MDWDWAIETNRAALKRVLAALIAMAGFEHPPLACRPSPPQGGRTAGLTLPRRLHRAILRLLRPAESAARRLVIVCSRNVEVTLPPLRPRKPQPKPAILRNGAGTGIVMPAGYRACPPAERTLLLPLTDRLRRPGRQRRQATGAVPRISFPGFAAPSPVRLPPAPGDRIDATRLAQRLAALGHVLDDVAAHARRFARWRARAAAGAQDRGSRKAGRIRRPWPLRAGRPPGQSRRPAHAVHAILDTLHDLAFWVLEPADTS